MSDRFDSATYTWRGADGDQNLAAMPMFGIKLKVMDDDTGIRGADADMGEALEAPIGSLLALSRLAKETLKTGDPFSLELDSITVKLHISIGASRCAVDWASQISQGIMEVADAQTANGEEPSRETC